MQQSETGAVEQTQKRRKRQVLTANSIIYMATNPEAGFSFFSATPKARLWSLFSFKLHSRWHIWSQQHELTCSRLFHPCILPPAPLCLAPRPLQRQPLPIPTSSRKLSLPEAALGTSSVLPSLAVFLSQHLSDGIEIICLLLCNLLG